MTATGEPRTTATLDVSAYLERIGYHGDTAPTLDNLRAMHRAHFYNVPFENLDIARKVPIVVDETINTEKIVRKGRGGFCLELTGTFARVLRALGYRVDVIGAQVEIDNTGAAPPDFNDVRLSEPLSHMIAIVHLEERWIADVGFGGRIIEPLRLDEREPQRFGMRTYVISTQGERYRVSCDEPGTPPGAYQFVLQPREFGEFNAVCRWLQTSPDSRFTHGDIVSLATPNGRVTFAEERLIVNEGGQRTERDITSAGEKTAILRDLFHITL
jgi:N-hydroxyarylamine O-acetyltransferase